MLLHRLIAVNMFYLDQRLKQNLADHLLINDVVHLAK